MASTGGLHAVFPDVVGRAKPARRRLRRFDDVAVQTGSTFFANVRDGKVMSFGVEPIGDVVVTLDGTVQSLIGGRRGRLDPARVAAAFGVGLAAAAAGVGSVAAVLRSRRTSQ